MEAIMLSSIIESMVALGMVLVVASVSWDAAAFDKPKILLNRQEPPLSEEDPRNRTSFSDEREQLK